MSTIGNSIQFTDLSTTNRYTPQPTEISSGDTNFQPGYVGDSGVSSGEFTNKPPMCELHGAGGGGGRKPPFMDDAEAVLEQAGLSQEDIESQLQQGQTLAQIATNAGVDVTSLTSAIATGIQQRHPNVSADDAQNIATGVVNGAHPHHGHAHVPPPSDDDTDTDASLDSDLQDAQSLVAIASGQGIDLSALGDALLSNVEQRHPDTDPSQLQQAVSSMVNGTQSFKAYEAQRSQLAV